MYYLVRIPTIVTVAVGVLDPPAFVSEPLSDGTRLNGYAIVLQISFALFVNIARVLLVKMQSSVQAQRRSYRYK